MEPLFFWGHRPGKHGLTASCLSQWWQCWFDVDGVTHTTAEQFMMAEKARLFGDTERTCAILATQDPREATRLGRTVANYDDDVWAGARYDIVVRGNLAKFSQDGNLCAPFPRPGIRRGIPGVRGPT